MNCRKIPNRDELIHTIQNALSENEIAKYHHRLHIVLLAIYGMSVKEIASIYNESPTTISYWIKKAVEQGVEALQAGKHTGRKPRLSSEQLNQLDLDLGKTPNHFGYEEHLWDGVVLSRHISDHYGVSIQVRQCQRIMRQLGYTLQRPQTKPSGGSAEAQDEFKKN